MSDIQRASTDTIFCYVAFLGFTCIYKCKATPIHPILRDPWSREAKLAFLSQQDYNNVRSGYSFSINVKNSKYNIGFIGKNDPYEALNTLAFSRYYFRYKHKNSTWILGSYRIQIGEGIIKSVGTPSYLSNPSWANKSEEWKVKEYRGFSRNFPVLGFAGNNKLSNKYQLIYSVGKAKLSGKMEDNRIVKWNRTGQLTDSIKQSQKNNFYCITSTTAIRYHSKFITAGLGLHSYVFSAPTLLNSNLKTTETNWFNYYHQTSNSNDSFPQDYLNNSNFIQQLHASEFWVTQSCKNGNMLYFNIINQLKQVASYHINDPNYNTKLKNHYTNTRYKLNDLRKHMAITSGLLIPLNKFNDVGIRFNFVGSEIESVENFETQQMKGYKSIQTAVQHQITPQLHIATSYLLKQKVSLYQLNQNPWEKILRCKIQYQHSNIIVKSALKLSQRESSLIHESSFSEISVQEEIQNNINPSDLDQLDVYWQQSKPPTIFQLHSEIQLHQNSTTVTELHSYLQNLDKQRSSCLEFVINKQWHNTVQSQSGFAVFNTSAPIVIQGLQLGTINSFQIVNNQGFFFFMGIRHKPSKELTQLLQLQIMQNFNPKRPISVRIFAVLWLR